VTSPERAIQHATEAAARARAEGAYHETPPRFEIEASRIHDSRLYDWALIEPSTEDVYSTRRLGAPITWIKRGLLRALRQYHGQMMAQQSRFNAHVAAHIMSLDDRVRALEQLAAQPPLDAGAASTAAPGRPAPPEGGAPIRGPE
jgi:hypothetical protein